MPPICEGWCDLWKTLHTTKYIERASLEQAAEVASAYNMHHTLNQAGLQRVNAKEDAATERNKKRKINVCRDFS